MEHEIKDCILDNVGGYQRILYVDNQSDRAVLDTLAQYARYFRWEMQFENFQFDESMYSRGNYVGFIIKKKAEELVEHLDHYPNRVIGAGVFQKFSEDKYELDWVWMHPFERNRGTLTSCWKEFKEKFRYFSIGLPWSEHMIKIVEKHHIEDQAS